MTASRHTLPGTVLVTGAAGVVGSPLCERLIERGHRVIALDDLSTGDPEHLQPLAKHPQFQFMRHDVTLPLPDPVRDAVQIYNLACPGAPAYRRRHPVATMLASTLGTWRLLELAWSGGARLLQVSGVLDEPGATDDEGERAAEAMALAYRRERGVGVRVARLRGVYGPRMRADDGRVVATLVAQALTGAPLTVEGAGLQTLKPCWVDDAVTALIRLMDSDASEPVDIGGNETHTVLEVAQGVLAQSGSRSRIEHRPDAAGGEHPAAAAPEAPPRTTDPGASVLPGWRPQTGLADGLQRTIAAFRARAEAPRPAAPSAPRTRSAALRELAPVSRW